MGKVLLKLSLFTLAFLPALVTLGCQSGSDKEVVVDRSEFNWQLVWSDEFDTKEIDNSKWNFIEGAGGYGNNELQYYSGREENARIKNGKLVIEARKEDYKDSPYTSAKLTTQGKGDWTYGRYEIRAKLPEGQGIWPAFWMMPSDYSVYGQWPSCGEIDIVEVLGHETEKTYGTLHYGNPHKYTGTSYTLENGSFSSDYHVFALEWLPGEIRWYVDGILYQTQNEWFSNPENIDENITYPAPFDRDFYLQLNLAVGGNWPGYPDDSTKFPQQLIIDWIRVYQAEDGYPRAKAPKTKSTKILKGRDPDENGNYVYNNSFDKELENWTFSNFEGGSGSASVENGEIHINIKNGGGQSWGNQLFQTDMNIQKGSKYLIKFKARAEQNRNFMLKIGGLEDRGWAAYSGEQIFSITPEMKEYSYQFTMKEDTDVKARYEFNLGLSDIDVWLDDIVLLKVGGEDKADIVELPPRKNLLDGNLLYNGTFDYGTTRLSYWDLKSDGGSDVMLYVSPEINSRELSITTLESSGMKRGITLSQEGFPIENDATYKLSLNGYSSNNRDIYVVLQDDKGNDLSEISKISFQSTNGKYVTTLDSKMEAKRGKLTFLLSEDDNISKIVMDNVSLIKVKKPFIINGAIKIEAEDFYDKTPTPQTQECSEGSLNVGWMTPGDWLEYRLNVVNPGKYKIKYRVASELDNLMLRAETKLGSDEHTVKTTDHWQNWDTVEGVIELPQGETSLKIFAVDLNLNWIELEPVN
ncbi:MAG: family 16 glycosylhydrolase [Spirochaetales bacterium]|nr:family 16 glycosylhydrolase [Spirochaetales bacterium]